MRNSWRNFWRKCLWKNFGKVKKVIMTSLWPILNSHNFFQFDKKKLQIFSQISQRVKLSFYEVQRISDKLTSSDVKKSHIAHFWRILMLKSNWTWKCIKKCINASTRLDLKNEGSIAKFGSLVPEIRHFINSWHHSDVI